MNVDATDVLFTSGSTESNNMAILGLLEYAIETGRNHFITTSIEHKSVLEAMKYLEKHGCVVDFVAPDETGRIKPQQILDLVTDKTLLVSLMHVNSETGIIQPIKEVGEALEKTPTYFHIDATQGFGKLNDEFEIIIGIQDADIYSPGAMLLFEVSMENPNKDMEHFFYQREKEHVYNGIGIEEDTIDVTLNNYGEFRNLNSFADSNMNMSGAFMPLYSYILNQTLKVLRQNAKKTGDIPSATVGSIYVPQMSLYNQSGYWSVISCGMNMRDDKYMLTRIPIQQNN